MISTLHYCISYLKVPYSQLLITLDRAMPSTVAAHYPHLRELGYQTIAHIELSNFSCKM